MVECWICGKEYNYCPHCRRYQTWMKHSCSPKHYQIELLLEEYREGIVNKTEAAQCFCNIGIDENYDFSEFLPEVARDIKDIINFEDVPTKSVARAKKNKKTK